MKKTALFFSLAILSLSAVAFADGAKTAPTSQKDTCAAIRASDPKARCKDVDMTGESLEGDVFIPLGENTVARGQTTHDSLIRPRLDFVDKIVASANDL